MEDNIKNNKQIINDIKIIDCTFKRRCIHFGDKDTCNQCTYNPNLKQNYFRPITRV